MLSAVAVLWGCLASAPAVPFEPREVLEQLRHSFRPEGRGFEADDGAHHLRVDARGNFTFAPVQTGLRSPELSVSLRSVKRGRVPVMLTAARAHLLEKATGTLVLDRGSVREVLENSSHGVEQHFDFAHKPPGTGALTVDIDVTGLDWAGQTRGGSHFHDPRTGLSVCYGVATWVTADGRRTELQTVRTARGLQLQVPQALVERGPYPAQIDPMISGELGLDDPIIGAPGNWEVSPAIASDGTNFLLVWSDSRRAFSEPEIYGARISASAGSPIVLLDPAGFVIAKGFTTAASPKVTFASGNYFVTWAAAKVFAGPSDIYGARVSPAGAVLDPNGITVCSDPAQQAHPAVAFDGANYFVVWEDQRGATQMIYGARVDPSGVLLDSPTTSLLVSSGPSDHRSPAIASDGTGSMVVWAGDLGTDSDIFANRVARDGSIQPPGRVSISTANGLQVTPAIAFDGTNFLVAWADARNAVQDIFGTRLTPTGVVLDPGNNLTNQSSGGASQPQLAQVGSVFFLTWSSGSSTPGVYLRQINFSAVPIAPAVFLDAAIGEAVVATNGSVALVVGTVLTFGFNGQQRALRVSVSGSVLDVATTLVTRSVNPQKNVSVAFDGTNYLVVWQDRRGADWDIYGARVAANGTTLDRSGIPICLAAGPQLSPVVTFDGTNYLVAWDDRRGGGPFGDIYAVRVTTGGAVLGAGGFLVSTANGDSVDPAIASDGAQSLVVWTGNSTGVTRIYGARVAGGTVLDSGGFLVFNGGSSETAAVAFNGSDFLVAWNMAGTMSKIVASRVSVGGGVLDAVPLVASSSFSAKALPAVTGSGPGSDWLVVWTDLINGMTREIYGARISSTGVVRDPGGFPLSNSMMGESGPAAAYDSTSNRYYVAWQDLGRTELNVLEMAATTTPPAPMLLSRFIVVAGDSSKPSLAVGVGSTGVVAYHRFIPGAVDNNFRARFRLLGRRADGAICAAPAQCLNGFCESGFCCSTVCPNGSTCGSGVCVPVGIDGGTDAGAPDAGGSDAGSVDGGITDGGLGDGGNNDGGRNDGGVSDGGRNDGGVNDGGSNDGGSNDGGNRDAGESSSFFTVGCGCSAGAGSVAPWLALVASLRRSNRRRVRAEANRRTEVRCEPC